MNDLHTILTFAGIIAAVILITLALGRRERARARQKLLRSLRESFGRPSAKRMHADRYARVPQYDLRHPGPFRIDDITWNDLDMDRLYQAMDTTCSASGEEYLYHLLRAPAQRPEDLPFTRDQYAYFAGGEHEADRLGLQEILTQLGHAGRYSLCEYIDSLQALEPRGSLPHYAAAAAPFLAFCLMFWNTGVGIVILILVCALNMWSYFREKASIGPYLQIFSYILRLLDCAQRLEKTACPAFCDENAKIPPLLDSFSGFRRGTGILLGGSAGTGASGGADPFGFVLDYVRILFHVDLIKFNSMLEQVRGKQEELDTLITLTGRIDACLSIVSWRESLPQSAWPELVPQRAFEALSLIHPLLTDPVSNDLSAARPVLLTGSNASGKSTFLKAAALCALLSQSVGIAPAARYRGSCFRIFTSMALRDSLQEGESYFIVEIKSLLRILRAAEEGRPAPAAAPVLCCIDEVLRGTNTIERISASSEILHRFAASGVLCLAATHDLELTGLLKDDYDNFHFSEEFADGDVRFSYRLLPGPSDSCNAIALLSVLGYDSSLVHRAQERADRFRLEGRWSPD